MTAKRATFRAADLTTATCSTFRCRGCAAARTFDTPASNAGRCLRCGDLMIGIEPQPNRGAA